MPKLHSVFVSSYVSLISFGYELFLKVSFRHKCADTFYEDKTAMYEYTLSSKVGK